MKAKREDRASDSCLQRKSPKIAEPDCDWDNQYCIACDKQTFRAAYCSVSCRLSDHEAALPRTFGVIPPTIRSQGAPRTIAPRQPQKKFRLSPNYDFRNPSRYNKEEMMTVSTEHESVRVRVKLPSDKNYVKDLHTQTIERCLQATEQEMGPWSSDELAVGGIKSPKPQPFLTNQTSPTLPNKESAENRHVRPS
ncbi:hypothetical protein MKZ38_003542 [Zalerion maritima]|uniref:Uncharacterized protein n=1 Tax=Zalerion maritima TaxID=339359 RepID=A0AAD5RMT1_9PEZI|nr:hypothetical protein MKZ38_003542 [Zalerion maritima]